MGAFEYTALDIKGRERSGVLEADAPRQIRQQLREQGLTPLTVEEVKKASRGEDGKRSKNRQKLSSTDLALVTRQWATLVRSGLPVEEALKTVANQSEKARLKSMIVAIRSRVMEGHSLAIALSDFPQVFGELYRATIEAGEQSGHLDVVLERLADYTEQRQVVSQKLAQAMIYPLLLTIVAILVVVGLLTFIVPKIVQVFDSIGQELPALTQALIASSDFLTEYGLILALFIALAIFGFSYMLKYERFRRQFHKFLLALPFISRLVRGVNAARFARTFSIVAASGVPVLDGLRISSQVITILPMREAVTRAASKVREGSPIHKALDASKYFPPMTIHLIASGEASGNIEEMLERAADSQERELEAITSGLLAIFEPILILVMGGIVLLIVLAILLPIFNMNELVK